MWTWARWLTSLLLQPGGVPQHVGLIMDGNRRYAVEHGIRNIQGHVQGYSKMVDVIHWCLELGVQFISVYAFSIDNFSRSLQEVADLMALAEAKYEELVRSDGLAERKGVEVRIVGDLSLVPPEVAASAARLMARTAALPAKQAVLNICFSYSSREEMIHSMDTLTAGLGSGQLAEGDVTPQLLHRCLRTRACPPVDLLIRTSGEARLSDFLLWQACHAQLEWEARKWPDWGYLAFAQCIVRWQLARRELASIRAAASARCEAALGSRPPPARMDTTGRGSAGLWTLPSNWAPHKFAPVWHNALLLAQWAGGGLWGLACPHQHPSPHSSAPRAGPSCPTTEHVAQPGYRNDTGQVSSHQGGGEGSDVGARVGEKALDDAASSSPGTPDSTSGGSAALPSSTPSPSPTGEASHPGSPPGSPPHSRGDLPCPLPAGQVMGLDGWQGPGGFQSLAVQVPARGAAVQHGDVAGLLAGLDAAHWQWVEEHAAARPGGGPRDPSDGCGRGG